MTIQQALKNAYDALGDATPLREDCGMLCGGACCGTDEDGQGGVWLTGPEAEVLANVEWAYIDEAADPAAPLLVCTDMCERSARPFFCRIFPLAPVMGKDGLWTVRMDARARPMCPLVKSGLKGLDKEFARRARDAVRALAQAEEGQRILELWAQREEEFRRPLW